MTSTTGAAGNPPRDYTELYEQYYDYVCNLVRRYGITRQRSEDVASDILLKFFERDFLAKFDPTLVFDYKGQPRPARFSTFLSVFVLKYLRGHRDRQRREAERELLLCDTLVGANDHGLERWVDVFGGTMPDHCDDVLEALDEARIVARMRAHIATVPRRSAYDVCDLLALFDEVVAQIRRDGTWNISELRAKFGVSSTAIHGWLFWLRVNLAIAMDRPAPVKKPSTRKPKPATAK